MRTTSDIADDVLQVAEGAGTARETGCRKDSSELARRALTAPLESSSAEEAKVIYSLRPFPARGGIVTNQAIDMLRDNHACKLNRYAQALNAEGDDSAAYQSDWESE